jgi:hypothetical protein
MILIRFKHIYFPVCKISLLDLKKLIFSTVTKKYFRLLKAFYNFCDIKYVKFLA